MSDNLPEFWSPETILAVKHYARARPTLYFSPIKVGLPFKMGEWYRAECRSSFHCANPPGIEHSKPLLSMQVAPFSLPACGFYGWKRLKRVEAGEYWYHAQNEPNVLVEFKGRVVEHERGYRAEYQRIIRELTRDELRSGIIKEIDNG